MGSLSSLDIATVERNCRKCKPLRGILFYIENWDEFQNKMLLEGGSHR